MSYVALTNVEVLDNPTMFTNPFQFEICFECTAQLQDDLEWKLVYVGSAENDSYDQLLDSILVGPIPVGVNRFVFQADAPDPSSIPAADLLGVTVCLLTCSYKDQEFVRVGYYVSNSLADGTDPETIAAGTQIDPNNIVRSIIADKPRVTTFMIDWES
ncbi:histone chaperone [Thecamonas trahens ATCC 50062]|uniref:Histone chaperone n=1 Tax=Thecamonas trahens ATCC 50062 TaxID=461836 RepID=A0A0L0DP10_THETB|nr:histone chaperone [Thecamonas trahens ATCC 50062]KNC53756.1 histone chaperone [Thecamonas trahens ATCC 50062]|eukprot:XP_013754319.1 histone chaperone [Thecamonas trahens ATCC 50062]